MQGGFFMGIIKRFKEQVVASDPQLTNQTYAGLPYLVQVSHPLIYLSTNICGKSMPMHISRFIETTACPLCSKCRCCHDYY